MDNPTLTERICNMRAWRERNGFVGQEWIVYRDALTAQQAVFIGVATIVSLVAGIKIGLNL